MPGRIRIFLDTSALFAGIWSAEWGGKVSREAIAEAVRLASQVFVDNVAQYMVEPVSA